MILHTLILFTTALPGGPVVAPALPPALQERQDGGLRGRIVDQDGQPVLHASLVARGILDGSPRQTMARVDDDGYFTIPHSGPGVHRLDLALPSTDCTWLGGSRHYSAGQDRQLVLKLLRMGPAHGVLEVAFQDLTTGEAVTPDWVALRPLAAALVPGIDTWVELSPESQRTRVESLPLGSWVLAAGGSTLHPVHIPFELTPDQPSTSLVAALHYPERATISGSVNWKGATPDQGARVRAVSLTEDGSLELGRTEHPWRELGPAGEFELHGVLVGSVRVELSGAGWLGCKRIDLPPWGSSRVSVQARRAARVRFEPQGAWRVELARPGEPLRATTADEGSGNGYTLEAGAWRWRLSLPSAHGATQHPARMQVGSLTLSAGERRVVRVDAARRAP